MENQEITEQVNEEFEAFKSAKSKYVKYRKTQRDNIISFFENLKKDEDFVVKKVVPAVVENGKRFSNWLGVDVIAKVNGKETKFYISLQAFDEDRDSGNVHVLMDRIGIYKYPGINEGIESIMKNKNILVDMKNANIDLPMNEYKKAKLLAKLKYFALKENDDEFKNVKDEYKQQRVMQKNYIIDKLQENNFEVLTTKNWNSGSGSLHYTNKWSIDEYDNSNWKWIDVKKDNKMFLISFQAFANDDEKYNKNCALMDWIGIYQYPLEMVKKYMETGDKRFLDTSKALDDMEFTGIDLPMNKDKLEELIKFLQKRINTTEN